MRYHPTLKLTYDDLKTIGWRNMQCGQYIRLDGAMGRFAGVKPTGTIWIAWAEHARKAGFATFCNAFKGK